MQNLKQYWPQYQPLRNTTHSWAPTGCQSANHYSLSPAAQFSTNLVVFPSRLYLPTFTTGMLSETMSKDLLKSRYMTSTALPSSKPALSEKAIRPIQVQFALGKSKLAVPNHHLVFHAPEKGRRGGHYGGFAP